VKGKHAFRASVQSRGAAASNPSLSKGKGKGKGKGKEIDIDIDSSDDEPTAITEPSASTTDPIPIPSAASASGSASGSKRKHSALGEDNSAVSGSRTSCSSGKRKQRGTALDGVKESLNMIGLSLCELASECKLRRLQIDARVDAAHEQGGKAESPQRRHEAMQRVQQMETHLDTSHVMALADLVAKDTIAADIYMSIEREDYHHAWVALKLKEMGFVEGVSF
jgi:hypothetical protein